MDGATLLKMGLTLALLLAVPGAMLWLGRRSGWKLPGQPLESGRLRVVARTALDAKHVVLLIRRDAQEQLLLLGPTGPVVLEAAIKLSAADKAEQDRQAAEQAERRAAAEAALAVARERASNVLRALAKAGRSAPTFARLVERAGQGSKAAPRRRRAPAPRKRA